MTKLVRKQYKGSGNEKWEIDDVEVTASADELNINDGLTATTAELNIMDGVTATTAELNIMDGVTATTAELNKLDGVASNATEIDSRMFTVEYGDITSAGASGAVCQFTGNIISIHGVTHALTATEAAFTTSIAGTAITDGGLTVADATAAWGTDTAGPSATNAVTKGQVVTVTGDGGATGGGKYTVSFLVQIT